MYVTMLFKASCRFCHRCLIIYMIFFQPSATLRVLVLKTTTTTTIIIINWGHVLLKENPGSLVLQKRPASEQNCKIVEYRRKWDWIRMCKHQFDFIGSKQSMDWLTICDIYFLYIVFQNCAFDHVYLNDFPDNISTLVWHGKYDMIIWISESLHIRSIIGNINTLKYQFQVMLCIIKSQGTCI